jgi:polysaccharide chain length determinant protein (PEP-CTERM system associated)
MPGFTISFTAEDPGLAQKICTEIVSMFMAENLKVREQQAQGTTDFLTKQLAEAKRKLDEQDARLAEFKRRHLGQLPSDDKGATGSVLMALNSQLDAATSALNRAVQDKSFTETFLQQQLAAWESSQTTGTVSPQALENQLAQEQAQLVSLEARYTPDHPDVVKLRADIAQLQKRISEAKAAAQQAPPSKSGPPALTEPGQITALRAQIHQLDLTIQEKTRDQERLQKEIQQVRARLDASPVIEQEYKELTRDYGTAQAFYDSLLGKQNQSEMATDLERRQQGEQFRMMDAPNLPELPSFPNPIIFTLGGLGGGLGMGFLVILASEFGDKAMRGQGDVDHFLGLPTLAILPSAEATSKNGKRGFWRSRKKKSAKLEEKNASLVGV